MQDNVPHAEKTLNNFLDKIGLELKRWPIIIPT